MLDLPALRVCFLHWQVGKEKSFYYWERKMHVITLSYVNTNFFSERKHKKLINNYLSKEEEARVKPWKILLPSKISSCILLCIKYIWFCLGCSSSKKKISEDLWTYFVVIMICSYPLHKWKEFFFYWTSRVNIGRRQPFSLRHKQSAS